MKKVILTLVALLLLMSFSCKKAEPLVDEDLSRLTSWMTGSFSSQEQADQDTNYFDIRLEMVRIWPENAEAVWLYVEQAAVWALERPYRQRVYRLSHLDHDRFESAIYSLESPLRFAGVWAEENPLAEITPDSLILREGCSILLDFKDDVFVGSTVQKNCQSNLRGASYARSEVRITEEVLTSWDRGFDAKDEQVWGAMNGPYIFKKIHK